MLDNEPEIEGDIKDEEIDSRIDPEKEEEKKTEEEKKEEQTILPQNELIDNKISSLNWLGHYYYVRGEYLDCLSVLSKTSKTQSEFEGYYSLFIKGLIKRAGGDMNESLRLFKQSYSLNDTSQCILKEIGKTFLLLGKFKMSVEIYDALINKNEEDWDSIYHKAICYMNMKNYDEANELFDKAYEINSLPIILKTQGKMLLLQNKVEEALEKYESALEESYYDAELYAKIGTLQLQLNDSENALDSFEKAINIDPDYSNGLLGLSSIYQIQGDYDKAFNLYKLSQKSNINSATVWNNLGLCFLDNGKNIYATSCLTKAYYLDPFDWGIAYNLGVALLHIGLYSSAFVYMNAAEGVKKDDYRIYMYLGIIFGELNDCDNAKAFYDKALSMESNYLILFNYTITLIKNEKYHEARNIFNRFKSCYKEGENDYDETIANMVPNIEELMNTIQ